VIASTAAAGSAETTADDGDALWTSNPFKGTISALATGDVDGDGRPDIVFAMKTEWSRNTGMVSG
jgi:hypothetical protein